MFQALGEIGAVSPRVFFCALVKFLMWGGPGRISSGHARSQSSLARCKSEILLRISDSHGPDQNAPCPPGDQLIGRRAKGCGFAEAGAGGPGVRRRTPG